jgi:hypothetical protein
VIEFRDTGKLRTWLAGQPPEVAIVFAVRATLRAVPTFPGQTPLDHAPNRQQIEDAILLTFRALSASWAWASFPAQRKFLMPSAASASAVLRSVKSPKFAVCEAGASAAFAASSGSVERSRFEAANAMGQASAALSAAGIGNPILTAHSFDADKIDQGTSVDQIAASSLWPSGKVPWDIDSRWASLKRDLQKLSADWRVWTDWYDQRLIGQRGNEPMETVRATLSEEVWGRGTRSINTHIALLLAERERAVDLENHPPIEAVPEQVSRALVFGGDENGPISLLDPPGEGLVDTADQRQGFLDVREKARLLDSTCGGSNRLAILKGFAFKLLVSMGSSLSDLKVRAFWSQMNSLRHRLEADVQVRASKDPESPSLPEDVSATLHDLVDALNVFAAHEPKLILLDELKRDPADRVANEMTLSATQAIAAAASASPQIVSREASEALAQVASETNGATAASERAKEFSARSARNLVLEIIRRSYKAVSAETAKAWSGARDGAYRAGGASAATYAAVILIKSNEAAVRVLIDTLGGSQTLHRIVDLIVKLF